MNKPKHIIPAGADAKPWDKLEPLFDDNDWVAERKLDGWRFLMHVGGGLKRVYLTGRNETKDGSLSERGEHAPLLTPPPRWMRKMAYTVLDGEIMPPPGRSFRDINGIMGKRSVEDALARIEEIGHPVYNVFDVLYYDGVDVRERKQRARYVLAQSVVADWNLNYVDYVGYMSTGKLAFFEKEVAEGQEGIILKDKNAAYGVSGSWLKVKRMHTLDVFITGFTDAKEGKTGKFKGLIGAIKVSVWRDGKVVEVGQVSGMVDEDRKMFTENPKRWIGTPIEIRAERMAKDRLRHPRFSRLRPDIKPTSCTWDKMQRDLKANKKK